MRGLPKAKPCFITGGEWGEGPFEAGYMPIPTARRLIRMAIAQFRRRASAAQVTARRGSRTAATSSRPRSARGK